MARQHGSHSTSGSRVVDALVALNQPGEPSTSFYWRVRGTLAIVVAVGLFTAAIVRSDKIIPEPAVTAQTVCSDFLKRPARERALATAHVAIQVGVPDPWRYELVPALEARCAAAPDLELGEYFRQLL